MDQLQKVVDSIISWVNRLFGFGDFYTFNYSKYVVYGLLILVVSKVLKVKLNVNTGRGGK